MVLVAALGLGQAGTANAQSALSIPLDGFVQRGKAYGVTAVKLGQTKIWRIVIEGDALGGVNISDAKASAGIAGIVPWTISPFGQFRFGVADMLDAQKRPTFNGLGLYFGFRLTR